MIYVEKIIDHDHSTTIYEGHGINLNAEWIIKKLAYAFNVNFDLDLDDHRHALREAFPNLRWVQLTSRNNHYNLQSYVLLHQDEPLVLAVEKSNEYSGDANIHIYKNQKVLELLNWIQQEQLNMQFQEKWLNKELHDKKNPVPIEYILTHAPLSKIYPDVFVVSDPGWFTKSPHLASLPFYTIIDKKPIRVSHMHETSEGYKGDTLLGTIAIGRELFFLPTEDTKAIDFLETINREKDVWFINQVRYVSYTAIEIARFQNGKKLRSKVLTLHDKQVAEIFVQSHQGLQFTDTLDPNWEETTIKQIVANTATTNPSSDPNAQAIPGP